MLKTLCLPLRTLADDLGVPYSTVRNWSSGRTAIPDERRAELADYMEKHGGQLQDLARELREAAGS